jgi:hypothetical protein
VNGPGLMPVAAAAFIYLTIVMSTISGCRRLGPVAIPLAAYLLSSIVFVNTGYLLLLSRQPTVEHNGLALAVPLVGVVGVAVVGGGYLWYDPGLLKRQSGSVVIAGRTKEFSARCTAICSSCLIAMAALYFVLLGYVPLIRGVQQVVQVGWSEAGSAVNTARLSRDGYVNTSAAYIPMQGLLESVRYFGMPLVACWNIRRMLSGDRSLIPRLLLATACLMTLLTGQRWPVMYMAGAVGVLLMSLPGRRPRIPGKVLLFAALVGVALTALLNRGGGSSGGNLSEAIGSGASGLADRVLTGYIATPYASYGSMHDSLVNLSGASWLQSLHSYLPGPGASYAVTFYQRVTGDIQGFTAPPDAYTEAYLNFGWAGVLAFSCCWGMLLAVTGAALTRSREQLHRSASMCVLTTTIAFSCFTGATFCIGAVLVLTMARVLLYCVDLVVASVRPGKPQTLRATVRVPS